MPSALFEDLLLQGSKQVIPAFLYGTAWKKERTADLVYQALSSGFLGVDTAAQPKHYREDLVGEGIRRAISEGKVTREKLFVSYESSIPERMDWILQVSGFFTCKISCLCINSFNLLTSISFRASSNSVRQILSSL